MILGIVVAGAVPVVILRIVQRRRQSLESDERIFLTCGVLFILLVLQFIPMFAAFSFKYQIGKFEAKIHEEMTAASGSSFFKIYASLSSPASEVIRKQSITNV